MDAIILAGGLGTRLRSVVSEVPKCMAPVRDQPFLYYLLNQFKRYEIDKVILSVGYLSEVIYSWIEKEGRNYPFEFEFSKEDEPLGTGGAIYKALHLATSSNVMIVNGDTFFDINIDDFSQKHISNNSLVSIALKPMVDFDRYGNVTTDGNTIRAFCEKEYCAKGQINGGIYILNRDYMLSKVFPTKFSFETEFLQPSVEDGKLLGFSFDNYFIDIGIPEDYQRAQIEL
ncbi:MAG: nucleotidyltransferase family protein [bacterium]